MGRNLFANQGGQMPTGGRNLLSPALVETLEEKALRLGVTPGVSLTKEQVAAIKRGEAIVGGEPQLESREYQQVPDAQGQPFLSAAGQEMRNVGAGILRAGGELVNALGIDGVRQFLNELEISQNISQQQTGEVTKDAPIQSFLGSVAGGTAAFPVGGGGSSLLARGVSGAVAGATGGGLSAAGRGEDVSGIAEEAAIGGIFGGVADTAPGIIKARQAKKAQSELGNAKVDIEDLQGIVSNIETSREAAKQTGIGLLPAQQTGDIFQSEMTAFLGQNPEVSKRAFNALNKQNSQAANAVNDLLNKIAPSDVMESAPGLGRRAAKTIVDNAKKVRKDKTAPLYKDAFETASEQGFTPDISATKAKIDDILKTAFDPTAIGNPIQKNIEKARKLIGENPTLKQLQIARFGIDDMLEGGKDNVVGSNSKRYLREIREEITNAMREFEPFAAADDEFKRLSPAVDKVKEGVFGRIQDLADKDLRRVSKMIFDPNEINNAQTVKNAVQALKGVEGGEDVARGLLRVELESRLARLPDSLEQMLESGTPSNIPGQLKRMIFGNDKQQKMLFSALEEIDPKSAKNALWLKTALDKARTSRPGGSQTGIRQEISKELRDGGIGAAIANFVRRPISSALDIGQEAAYNHKVRAIGEALYNPDWAPDLDKIKKLNPNSIMTMSAFEKLLNKIEKVNLTQPVAVGGRESQREETQQ